MLNLCDLIGLAKIQLGRFKIHCATGSLDSPLLAFFEGRFKEWQEHQTRRNFECEKIVSLIHRHSDKWLFAGVWSVQGVTTKADGKKSWFQYSISEVPGIDHLAGRVIVSFSRSFRQSYLQGSRYSDRLTVSQILEERMSMRDFPGYSSVRINFGELRHIVNSDLSTWRSALRSVAGVYLVSDTSCGKHYVGSAYGTEGIWGRWRVYSSVGHGNNAELRNVLAEKGESHARCFQFAILEICDIMATQDEVLTRESHWKSALLSRTFGYNAN
jgi:hypothetical protein